MARSVPFGTRPGRQPEKSVADLTALGAFPERLRAFFIYAARFDQTTRRSFYMSRPSRLPRRTFALLAVASAVVCSGLSHAQAPAKPAATKPAAAKAAAPYVHAKLASVESKVGNLDGSPITPVINISGRP